MKETTSDIFERVSEFPDPRAKERFARLIGIDDIKSRLVKEGRLLLDRSALDGWSKRHYRQRLPILDVFVDRPPLFIFAGDVGTGKTETAKVFGDEIARRAELPIRLYSLSLNARGHGAVGEMTMLIARAFAEVRGSVQARGEGGSCAILLVDEADSLAQSRELSQMHHEDRAGVNALIRGIDSVFEERLPILIVMCTNRLEAIDPAVQRRAAATFVFERPSLKLRAELLRGAMEGIGFSEGQIQELARATGERDGRSYGCTFSDLRHRFIPSLVLDAFPDKALSFDEALAVAQAFVPTPPFKIQP